MHYTLASRKQVPMHEVEGKMLLHTAQGQGRKPASTPTRRKTKGERESGGEKTTASKQAPPASGGQIRHAKRAEPIG